MLFSFFILPHGFFALILNVLMQPITIKCNVTNKFYKHLRPLKFGLRLVIVRIIHLPILVLYVIILICRFQSDLIACNGTSLSGVPWPSRLCLLANWDGLENLPVDLHTRLAVIGFQYAHRLCVPWPHTLSDHILELLYFFTHLKFRL